MDLYIHGGYSLTVNPGTIVFTAAKTYTVSFNANGGKRFDYRMLRCTGKNSCSKRIRVFSVIFAFGELYCFAVIFG